MKIVITGATGFIGSHLTQHFVSQGWKVLGLCRRPPDREQNPGVEFVPYELGEPVPQDALTGCGALIHCAHVLYSPRQRDADKLNIEGSRQLFRAAQRAGVGKILYLSSLSAHPQVQSHYARSKLEVESLLNPERDTILRLGIWCWARGDLPEDCRAFWPGPGSFHSSTPAGSPSMQSTLRICAGL